MKSLYFSAVPSPPPHASYNIPLQILFRFPRAATHFSFLLRKSVLCGNPLSAPNRSEICLSAVPLVLKFSLSHLPNGLASPPLYFIFNPLYCVILLFFFSLLLHFSFSSTLSSSEICLYLFLSLVVPVVIMPLLSSHFFSSLIFCAAFSSLLLISSLRWLCLWWWWWW